MYLYGLQQNTTAAQHLNLPMHHDHYDHRGAHDHHYL